MRNNPDKPVYILGIESSCDDTSASVVCNSTVLSNIIAGQQVHARYGGVVPELASRAHQQNIIPVVDVALREAGISRHDLSAVAFTRGPGLLGSLLVGASFAKGFALAAGIPLIDVNHLHAHVMALFLQEKSKSIPVPRFPFLCLLVSGGNSQIIRVTGHLEMEVLGQTIDDAAGEAFDKCAKVLGLPYPGGPFIDKLSEEGNPDRFPFAKPSIPGLDYSFSGLKTSFLYFLRDQLRENPDFIEENKADLAASLQKTIVEVLMNKLIRASKELKIKEIAVAGGVSANSGLRAALRTEAERKRWNLYIPDVAYTMDNAAMIAVTGYFKFLKREFAAQDVVPFAKSIF